MKALFTLVFLIALSTSTTSQSFLWAHSYDINQSNEVAALTVHSNGAIYMAGVYGAPHTLPFIGNAYLVKTDLLGQTEWTEYLSGSLQIGDIAAVNNNIIVAGQSNGPFTYKGALYGQAGHYMFIMGIDQHGVVQWLHTDAQKTGREAKISVGSDALFAVHVRRQSNIGDWVLIMNENGDIINSKLLSSTTTMITDISYYNDLVYLNGGFHGPAPSIMIDTIEIHRPTVEHATFVLALNENLIATWVTVDTTINNRDGRIVANENGIFAYQNVLRSPFTVRNKLKKLNFTGQLVAEVEIPFYTTSVTLYPDMVGTQDFLGIFAANAFSFDSHKVLIYDYDLNLLDEKVVDGPSDLYSGQISWYENDLIITHVHSGNLNFDNELSISYTGPAKKPYLARITNSTAIGLEENIGDRFGLTIYPNPARDILYVSIPNHTGSPAIISIMDQSGRKILSETNSVGHTKINVNQLPAGLYLIRATSPIGSATSRILIVR